MTASLEKHKILGVLYADAIFFIVQSVIRLWLHRRLKTLRKKNIKDANIENICIVPFVKKNNDLYWMKPSWWGHNIPFYLESTRMVRNRSWKPGWGNTLQGSIPWLSASSVMSSVLQIICDSKFNERLIHLVPVKINSIEQILISK